MKNGERIGLDPDRDLDDEGHCRPLALFPEGHSHTCSADLDL